jgi:galactokinase
MNKHIKNLFSEKFGYEADKTYFAPGRVNIIGEHTDYNGGLVMPFCIDKGIYAAVNLNNSKKINVYSENFSINGIVAIDLDDLGFKKLDNYGDYILGIIKEFENLEIKLGYGINICLSSNLPVGGGLSSSAALSELFLKIFNDEYNLKLSMMEIVNLAKAVENNFLGVSCGIMDQFVIMFGKSDNALYLNTKTLEYDLVPLDFSDFNFVLINSNTTRKLVESKYNERQRETSEILSHLQKHFAINYLADIDYKDIDKYTKYVSDKTLKKRLRHVVFENNRVKEAKKALADHDLVKLGNLLTEAHWSVSGDYEASSPLLDELVEMALNSGALGARMIGGGFGGSTLNLVLKQDFGGFIERFKVSFQKRYEKQFLYSVVCAKDGIKQID